MDIDSRDLEMLEALDRLGTLTAAAEHLYVSQPALSQRLRGLEDQVGGSLFDRRGRGLVATPLGRRMQLAARRALHELRTAEQDVRELLEGSHRPVRLSAQCTHNYRWLAAVLPEFRQRRPGVSVVVETMPEDEPVDALLDDRIDLALVTKLDRQMDRVSLQRLFDDELFAVVAADHHWAGRQHVEADDFLDVHLVLCDSYDPRRENPVPLPIPTGARPARLTTLPLITDLIVEMIVADDAVTILPSWIAAPYLQSHDIATIQVGARAERRTWYCATRHGEGSDAVTDLVDVLATRFDGYSPPHYLRDRGGFESAGALADEAAIDAGVDAVVTATGSEVAAPVTT